MTDLEIQLSNINAFSSKGHEAGMIYRFRLLIYTGVCAIYVLVSETNGFRLLILSEILVALVRLVVLIDVSLNESLEPLVLRYIRLAFTAIERAVGLTFLCWVKKEKGDVDLKKK